MTMERILLGVLNLSGWLILSTCLLHQYHYIADSKTWTEAQTYCRETHIDLATVGTTEEMNKLTNIVSSSGHNWTQQVWIGLYGIIMLRWSDGYRGSGTEYRNWETAESEQEFYVADQFCVTIGSFNGMWQNDYCHTKKQFICYRGTQVDPEFVIVSQSMNWTSAQRYCRENYRDLATVRNHTENHMIQSMLPSGSGWAWIGLVVDPHFSWSDQSNYLFSYWDNTRSRIGSLRVVCGFAALLKSGKWGVMSCNNSLPFVCYSTPAPLMKQVVKLRIKPNDSSVDLNDPAVEADILKKLQDRLEDKALSGVTLKWRKQTDGKVFHKKGKSSRKKQQKKTEF